MQHAHIPNNVMHHATLYHTYIFYVHFGAFSMVNVALKSTKKGIYTLVNPINHQNICLCFINAHFKNCQLCHTFNPLGLSQFYIDAAESSAD